MEPQTTIDLGLITAKVYRGCMGLPQEVVERIMDMLRDDRRALKACSLTCKAMFASTRHLIHERLHITKEINRKMLTLADKKRYAQGENRELELRFLSFMGECDLLRYTRHLSIRMGYVFSPYILEPHLEHLRSLDRIHTLTIYSFDIIVWRDAYSPYFTQFHSTLTTLALHSPTGHYRYVLQFALQFPNLDNLTLENLRSETWVWPGISVPPTVSQSPPLRGHFRCADLNPMNPVWPREFAFGLPNGINFRSVEFLQVEWEQGQHILDGCASSLEEFSVTITGIGEKGSSPRPLYAVERKVLIRIPRGH